MLQMFKRQQIFELCTVLCRGVFKVVYSFHSFKHSFIALSVSYVWDGSGRGARSNGCPSSKCCETEQVPSYGPPTSNSDHQGFRSFFQLCKREGLLNKLLGRVLFGRAPPGHGQKRWMCVAFVNCFTNVPTTFEICFNSQNMPFSALQCKKGSHRHLSLSTSLQLPLSPYLIFTALISTSTKVTQPSSRGAGTEAQGSPSPPPNKA